jgi:putative membrane protein
MAQQRAGAFQWAHRFSWEKGMRKGFAAATLFALCAGLLAGCTGLSGPDMRMGAGASTGAAPATVAAAPFTAVERDFVTRVAAKGMYEVEVSRLAADKATSPAVRDFARTMVTHHTQMNNELVALMSARGIAPPKGLAADKATKLHRLASLPRSDAFDNGYIRVVGVEDHRAAIAQFEKARRDAKDRELRSFIDRSLATMRMHLQMAQDVVAGLQG